MSRTLRIVLLVSFSLALILGGAVWAVRGSGVGVGDARALLDLPGPVVMLVIVLCLAVYAADVHRYRVLGRLLGAPVTRRTALEASIANFFFGWTTPGTAFGAPAAAVVLARRGVPWDAATLIAFGKSLVGTAVVLTLAFLMLLAGWGPALDPRIRSVLLAGTGAVTLVLGLALAEAIFPGLFSGLLSRLEKRAADRPASAWRRAAGRLATVLRKLITRLGALRGAGLGGALRVLGSHLAYFAVFIGVAVVLALALGADAASRAVGISTVYVAFSYVAPTPGGAGLAEAAATLFFVPLLPATRAVVLVLLFRALTFYLQIVVGVLYLPFSGLWRAVVREEPQ